MCKIKNQLECTLEQKISFTVAKEKMFQGKCIKNVQNVYEEN